MTTSLPSPILEDSSRDQESSLEAAQSLPPRQQVDVQIEPGHSPSPDKIEEALPSSPHSAHLSPASAGRVLEAPRSPSFSLRHDSPPRKKTSKRKHLSPDRRRASHRDISRRRKKHKRDRSAYIQADKRRSRCQCRYFDTKSSSFSSTSEDYRRHRKRRYSSSSSSLLTSPPPH